MARFDKIVDLYFSDDGDFSLGSNNDLEDTNKYDYRGFMQRILTRLSSKKREWAQAAHLGANLSDFVGKPNTEEIGNRIQDRIYSVLLQEDLLYGHEFTIDVVPVTKYEVAIIMVITPPRNEGGIVLTFSYDMRNNRLIPRSI